MIRSLFSPRTPAPIRGVQLYLSDASVIVAPLHQSPEGIYFEQPAPLVIGGPPQPEPLGAAFQKAFAAFSIQERDLEGARRGDWPAFQASGLRSVKEFQNSFRPMQCFGLNASNALVRAVMQHPAHEDIELSVSMNPLLPASVIGEKFLELARVAKALATAR
jgi:hypothetical protein